MKKQRLPRHIYALRRFDDGGLVPPALDDDGTNSFLAFSTLNEAKEAAEFQYEFYDVDSEPVKLK